MTLAERDAYVIARLATLAAQGITGQQAVNEVIRTGGFDNLALTGHDYAGLVADIAGIQSAASVLTVPANKADTKVLAESVTKRQALHPPPKDMAKADVWRLRALNAGV